MDVILPLSSGLIATLVTIIVTIIQQRKQARKNFKMQVFQDLIAYRTDITDKGTATGNFSKAINLVFVAYNDSPAVLDAFEKFRKSVHDKKDSIDDLITMLKLMAKELHINYDFSNDSLFTVPIIII